MPAFQLPRQSRIGILKRREPQIVVVIPVMVATGPVLQLPEVITGEEAGGGVALEAVEEAIKTLLGEGVVVIGLTHAVGTAMREGVLLDL